MTFVVPRTLASTARAEGHEAWLDALPSLVARYAKLWSLTVDEPFQPGGQTAWVAPALTERGEERVLKIGSRHLEAEHEACGLQAWTGNGAVMLYEAAQTPETTVLLLERCRPGRPLSTHRRSSRTR